IEANHIKDELIEIRRTLHQYPELGFEETNTSKFIKDFLTKEGITFKEFAGTGVCGIIEGTKEGENKKVIGLRADIDGLPMQDKKSCSYASKISGKMHACGHDGHTTILLGAAKLLNKNKDKFNGTIKLIFEPAEETTGGARVMIEEGVLTNPNVDVMCGLHVEETLDAGMIMVRRGTVNAASNPFNITIKGSGGHGAYPDTAIDPIVMASHVVTSLQSIVSREIKPVNPAVVTIGSIHGGTAQNIIPNEVKLGGIIRTMTNEDREFAKLRLYGEDEKAKADVKKVLLYVLNKMIALLHPFMPFITEEIYSALPDKKDMLIVEDWPIFNEEFEFISEEATVNSAIEAITAIRNQRATLNVGAKTKQDLIILAENEEYKNLLENLKGQFKNLANSNEVDIY
ncbi:MAG: amidohydrolase, partial [Anaerococcus sp.]|nr:amidohydrolase [Anaerococcus sp.]